jgi:tripartite-type tricarboxylate transporter receptor subunit TctC
MNEVVRRTSRRMILVAGLGAATLAGAPRVSAQEMFASRPIKILVGAGAGGTTDITARLVGQHLSKLLGQTVVIDNKPGAAGTVSMQQMVRAPADGYTLNWVGNSVMAIAPYL